MSNYNSLNTIILATHDQSGGNTRMLLLHECENGRLEYVVGSYFQQKPWPGEVMDEGQVEPCILEYEWYWGHYFSDGLGDDGSGIVNAVDYWKQEVLGEGSEHGIEG